MADNLVKWIISNINSIQQIVLTQYLTLLRQLQVMVVLQVYMISQAV